MNNVFTSLAPLITSLLTLAFSTPARAQETAAAKPTLYVIGDSTASNDSNLGWGSHLGKYFDAEKINVINRARAGRSSRTFQSEGLWESVREQLQPGDFVLIQFGHNDGGQPGTGKDRSSLPGLGDESVTITNNRGEEETVHTFGWYMRQYVRDTRDKGATPIILSLTVRNIWQDGRVERGSGSYGAWAKEVAEAEAVLFVDLTSIIANRYEGMGEESVKALFPIDHVHNSAEGADLNAQLVVAGLKGLDAAPLTEYLSSSGDAIPSEDGSQTPTR